MKFAIAAALLLLPGLASAQSLADLTNANVPPLSLSLSPANPQPYSTATLTVTSSTIDLANATLALSVGGKQIYKGAVQALAVSVGAAGVATNINAVLTSGGQSYSATLSVVPGDVSLVEEPLATAPPLYAGKPLVPLSGTVRLVAIAGFRTAAGAAINPANLSYSWKQDGDTLSGSGIGKSAIVVATPLQYRASSVEVDVSTQDGAAVGGATISIASASPVVRIYASDPLLGIRFDHALTGAYAIKEAEASFYAAPYSFPLTSSLSLSWLLNGGAAGVDRLLTLRPTGSGAGNGSLSVSASAGDSASATAGLSLSFGSAGSTNLLGL